MSRTARPQWYAHPDLAGVRVCTLTFGGLLALGQGDAGQPPGADPEGPQVGYSVTWCLVDADPQDWPYRGWFRLAGPLDSWASQISRSGGLVPDAVQVAYWRAYAQVLDAELRGARDG